MPEVPLESVERIVVLRANGLGDYLFALPALTGLRRSYPSASITYVGLPWHLAELAGRPAPVDRYVAAPYWPGVSAPDTEPILPKHREAAEPFLEAMRGERFDLGVQMHGGGRNSNPFLLSMAPRFSVGASVEDAQRLDRALPFDHYQPEVARWKAVAELAGAVCADSEPVWTPTGEERARSCALLPPDGRPLALIAPGAGAKRRRWSTARFAQVADTLTRAGARVVLIGAAPDKPLAYDVAKLAAVPAESIVGATSLGVLGAVCSRASVVVSNDSGPLHLARAAGAPTVGIYWCGNAINAGPQDVSRHRMAISWRSRCPECGADCHLERCPHDSSFVDDVPPEEVATKAEDLLHRFGRPDVVAVG